MEQQNYYNEPPKDGLTFKDVGKYLKKAAPFTIVCLIICCIIVSIAGLVMQYTVERTDVAYGVIKLSFSGIEEGKNPLGGTFNPDEMRNISVVSKALEQLGFNKKGDPTDAEIRGALSVEGNVPGYITDQLDQLKSEGKLTNEALESLAYHPTMFTITLDTSKVANLSNANAKRIVDQVMLEYQKWFQTHYKLSTVLVNETVDNEYIKTHEFADSVIYMNEQMDDLTSTLYSLNARSGNFIDSKGTSFNNYISALNVLNSKYYSAFSTIKYEGIARDLNKTRNIIKAKNNEFSDKLKNIETQLADYKEILKGFDAILTPPAGADNSNIIITFPDSIADWIKEISARQTALADQKRSITDSQSDYARWEEALTAAEQLPEESEVLTETEATLISLSNDFTALLAKIDNAASEFWNYDINANVSVLNNAMLVTTKGAVPWVIMFVVAIVVGIAVGLIFAPAVSRAISKHARNKKVETEALGSSEDQE